MLPGPNVWGWNELVWAATWALGSTPESLWGGTALQERPVHSSDNGRWHCSSSETLQDCTVHRGTHRIESAGILPAWTSVAFLSETRTNISSVHMSQVPFNELHFIMVQAAPHKIEIKPKKKKNTQILLTQWYQWSYLIFSSVKTRH